MPAEEIFLALRERKILVRYFKTPRLDDCLRISIGTDGEINALLMALEEILGAGSPGTGPEPGRQSRDGREES